MAEIFDPYRTSMVALDVLAANHASPAALLERQKGRLLKLLDAAKHGSAIYRDRLQGLVPASAHDMPDLPDMLQTLPVLSRQELMGRFDDWVTDPQLKLDELRAFTSDPTRIGVSFLGKYLVWESSGTSHQPGIFVQDAPTMAVYDALESLRCSSSRPLQRWFDPLMLSERIAFVGATSGHFASMVSMQRLRRVNPLLTQRLRCFSIMQPIHTLVDELNAFAPTVIATYPTVAAMLVDAACRGQLRFLPREVLTGGETLSHTVRQHVESGLGCKLRNSYGASEFLSIGWECSHGHMHANTDWLILEPVDEQGQPTPTGQPSASTLLTNLANHVQPLIRFDLGDQITIHTQRCACGSSLPVIDVQGRRDEPLFMVGAQGQRVTLVPLALTTVLEDEAGVFDFQLCQRDTHTLVLRLDLQGEKASSLVARCQEVLLKFAKNQGVVSIRVLVESQHDIPRGRSGKAQRVLRMEPKGH